MLTLAHRSPIGETVRPTERRAIGNAGIDLPGGHLDVALTDQVALVQRVILPFESAWLFPPPSYLCWQRVSAALGLSCHTGTVRLTGEPIVYGCWLTDLTADQAAAVATLADQTELLCWTHDAVTFYREGLVGPAVRFGWVP